jgi:hypothetical protein
MIKCRLNVGWSAGCHDSSDVQRQNVLRFAVFLLLFCDAFPASVHVKILAQIFKVPMRKFKV